jgi:mannose-6-phosphate isomerase
LKPEIVKLVNPIQHYAWGSREALASLQGRSVPSAQPEAELWIGDHPVACSRLEGGDETLSEWISRDPVGVLGPGRQTLPFLVKILAAERSLSVQVHPDAERARAGYERETRAGTAPPQRSYRDPDPKLEVLVALSRFEALCGFQADDAVLATGDELSSPIWHDLLSAAGAREPSLSLGIAVFHALQGLDAGTSSELCGQLGDFADRQQTRNQRWVGRLLDDHPGDPLAAAPLLMNCVILEPDEAVVVRPGTVHTYLRGVGVEVMTRSDNVIRGGLTPKHIDPDEFRAVAVDRAEPAETSLRTAGEDLVSRYDLGIEDFELASLRLAAPHLEVVRPGGRVAVVLCVEGAIDVVPEPGAPGSPIRLSGGEAALVPAGVEAYRLRGSARTSKVFEVSSG